jgi:HJR/Mrr/RecB family endonuclease
MHDLQSKGVAKSELVLLAQKLSSDKKQFLKQLSDNINVTDIVDQFRQFVDR